MSRPDPGARVHRVYDRAQTPFQRLSAASVLSPDASDGRQSSLPRCGGLVGGECGPKRRSLSGVPLL